jgi:probable HAF family extracellular repeat protein
MKTTHYSYATIDPPGSTYTIAEDINNKGKIVGFYEDINDQTHAFLDSGGNYTTIDPPGSVYAKADAINGHGQIIGYYTTDPSSGHSLGFLDSGGTYTTIDPAGSHSTEPLSINARGEVVGVYRDGDGVDHGFLYNHGAYTVIDVPGALDTYADSVNDKGTIAGYYLINPTRMAAKRSASLKAMASTRRLISRAASPPLSPTSTTRDRRSDISKKVAMA